jgi:GT2 family glycosyltransferase/glycosyltransferase involved in cell wall biosynthesis
VALPTVVVAIHGACDAVRRCVDSVLVRTDRPYRLLLIDDASPQSAIATLLRSYGDRHPYVEVLSHEENRGYTATINAGCRHADGDVVLLNSDTEVTDGWLTKLQAVAYSRADVATVTPLSNAAGAFSVPEVNANLELPGWLGVSDMGALVERLSDKVRSDVPTGNGFCMYIRRSALDRIGGFDEQGFPRGYGEENDFCMRADAAGFVHLVDDATFVYHQRSASFGDEKRELIERARGELRRRHPAYKERVEAFLRDTSLDPLRERLGRAMAGGPSELEGWLERPVLLLVVHAAGGGVPKTNADLAGALATHFDCLVLRCDLHAWSLQRWGEQLESHSFTRVWDATAPMDEERGRTLASICDRHRVAIAHVRSLLASGPEVLEQLHARGLPTVFSFHDFATICPTIQLLDAEDRFCGGTCTDGAADCTPSAKWFGEPPVRLRGQYVHAWRARMAAGLNKCDALVTTSQAARRVITDNFPFVSDGRLCVIPHGRDVGRAQQASVVPTGGQPQRIVVFGALGRGKGIALLDEVMRLDRQQGPRFEFHVLGTKTPKWEPQARAAAYHGPYRRAELPGRLAEIVPSYALIASTWPETYCHTLTEAWHSGIPVLASDIGTLRERIAASGGGWLLDHTDPARWYERMCEIADDPSEWRARRREIKAMAVRTVDDMAADYRTLYLKLLASTVAVRQ